jgi:hypothetical protein
VDGDEVQRNDEGVKVRLFGDGEKLKGRQTTRSAFFSAFFLCEISSVEIVGQRRGRCCADSGDEENR